MQVPRSNIFRSGSTFAWVLAVLMVAVVVHIVILTRHRQPTEPVMEVPMAEKPAPPQAPPPPLPELPLPDITKPVTAAKEPRRSILAKPQLNITPDQGTIATPAATALPVKTYPALALTDKRAEQLLHDAVRSRQQDDIGTAIAKLREAERLIPNHPRLLFELATTLEQIGRTDKAAEAYQKVHAMGADVTGPYHALAYQKLTEGMRSITSEAPIEEVVYIGNVDERRDPIIDPGDGSNIGLTLEITASIQSRPGAVIEDSANDVYIAVHLVDIVDGFKEELIASEPPKQQWLELPVDWKDGGLETLRLTYTLPQMQDVHGLNATNRKYLGYVIELYYKGRLVDLVARPRRLARFTPSEAQPDTTATSVNHNNLPPEGFTDPSEW